jgi:hypothetical protein
MLLKVPFELRENSRTLRKKRLIPVDKAISVQEDLYSRTRS